LINREYNEETREGEKTKEYVQLLPLGYFKQTTDKTESADKMDNKKYIYYKPNNPSLFWKTLQ